MHAKATRSYVGSCHCGAMGFTYRTEQDPSLWSVRACQCSFCRAHHVLSTSDPNGEIEFVARTAGCLNCYRFGERTADFLICRECGVYIGALMTTDSGSVGIININALSPIPAGLPHAVAMQYGSESMERRIARRAQRWSPASSNFVCPGHP